MTSIGVALSGGGYRATMWGIGALMYLADAGKHRDVVAISSVSGGSVANGVVAHETDFRRDPGDGFARRVRPLIRHCAHTGLFFWGPSTNRYVISLFALTGIAGAVLLAGVVATAVDGLRALSGSLLGAGLLLLAGALFVFQRRSGVVDRALARELFHHDGVPTALGDVRRSVDHVFCATELQSGDHFYFSPGFAYGFRFGTGVPGDLRLSTAVQSSACLPGAFAVRRLPTARHRFVPPGTGVPAAPPATLVLTDGGVYDNMADQWLVGLADRVRRPGAPPAHGEVDEIVVVNASAGMTWDPFPASRLPVVGELAALNRVRNVMYDVSTSHRRSGLVRSSGAAARSGGPVSALVHIAQSPYRVADAYAGAGEFGPDAAARAARAKEVLALLGDDAEHRAVWQDRADRSRRTGTVLRRLGADTTADLLFHAYTLTACNLHVLFGHPLPAALPDRGYFADLVGPPGRS
ncbi:patatin-like phospholipase family protein [Kitasatospora sp. NPDC004240]